MPLVRETTQRSALIGVVEMLHTRHLPLTRIRSTASTRLCAVRGNRSTRARVTCSCS